MVTHNPPSFLLRDIAPYQGRPSDFILWLGQHNFLKLENRRCGKCSHGLALYGSRCPDGLTLKCTRRSCRSRYSVRTDSFFMHGNISLYDQFQIIIAFASNCTASAFARMQGHNFETVAHLFAKCRQNISSNLQLNPIVFSGLQYEVDECIVKLHREEGLLTMSLWVAGILERESGKAIIYAVRSRSKVELLPPIMVHVPEGSIIYSDELPVYKSLARCEKHYKHYTVNHSRCEYSKQVIDAEHGLLNVHINNIEKLWSFVRGILWNPSRRDEHLIGSYLDEIMFFQSNRDLFEVIKI